MAAASVTQATMIAPQTFAIDSFTTERSYTVTLGEQPACSCPHFQKRLAGSGAECKHITAVRAQQFARLEAKAGRLPSEQLAALLGKYEAEGRLEIALAIRGELQDREQRAREEAALKALFS